MKYRPKLDPKVDLKGATPEKLARALFRPLSPHPRRQSSDGDDRSTSKDMEKQDD